MASTVKETVRVDSLGKWGPKVGNEFYSYSKNLKEADKGKIVPGGEYLMELYIADSGKRYINSVLSTVATGSAPVQTVKKQPQVAENSPVKSAKTAEIMTKAEWSAKDRSQLIGGLSHDAAAIVAALLVAQEIHLDDAIPNYKSCLTEMLKIREELK